jgi:hypothetical protein
MNSTAFPVIPGRSSKIFQQIQSSARAGPVFFLFFTGGPHLERADKKSPSPAWHCSNTTSNRCRDVFLDLKNALIFS